MDTTLILPISSHTADLPFAFSYHSGIGGLSASHYPRLQQKGSNITRPPSCQRVSVKKIRPLPPIPTSASPTTPEVARGSPRSLRPLPSTPSPPPQPPVVISVTPATPLPPPTPALPPLSVQQLSPPSHPRRPAFSSLSLQTSPDALAPSSKHRSMLSPLTPEIPQAPSPKTARRKRMSKLRRHLGERVPDELVFGEAAAALTKVKVVESWREMGEGRLYSKAAIAARKVLEIEVHNESDSEEEEEGEEDHTWVLAHGRTFRAVPVNRYSRKWIREKGGRRWEESNYSDVLRALRAL